MPRDWEFRLYGFPIAADFFGLGLGAGILLEIKDHVDLRQQIKKGTVGYSVLLRHGRLFAGQGVIVLRHSLSDLA